MLNSKNHIKQSSKASFRPGKFIKLLAIIAFVIIAGLLIFKPHDAAVAKVAGREITQGDVNELGHGSASKDNKVKLIADGYLYDGILKDLDSTYDTQKIQAYSDSQVPREKQNNPYYKRQYLTNDQKRRIQSYLRGGGIADFILFKQDKNLTSGDSRKVLRELAVTENYKTDLAQQLNNGDRSFEELQRKAVADKGDAVRIGQLSTLGAIDASQTQRDIGRALQDSGQRIYGDQLIGIDLLKKVDKRDLPTVSIVYKIKTPFPENYLGFDDFINQKKKQLGYEIY